MRRYLTWFAVSVTFMLIPAAVLSFLFEPINGDLTRIGHYSERDFGWNSPQPAVRLANNGSAVTDPAILVLGDSFSRENVWQTALGSRLGKTILSFHYAQSGCIKNWIAYSLGQPSAKTVVIEVVERDFVDRFRELQDCPSFVPRPFEMSSEARAAARPPAWPPEFHVLRTFRIAINMLKTSVKPDAIVRDGSINAPIDSTCAAFSNRRTDRLLYYPDDERKLRWNPDDQTRAVSNAIQIQRAFAARGKTLIFVVVPDKLTVYQDCLRNDPEREARKRTNVTAALISAGSNTPDLLQAFRENTAKITDLYYPNNTHLSTSGYIFMAEKLLPFFTGKPDTVSSPH